jgi:Ser/Thr protein kinase RdoA (MazF antagonist)
VAILFLEGQSIHLIPAFGEGGFSLPITGVLSARTLDFASGLPVGYNRSMKKTEPYIEESARAFGIDHTTLEPLVGNSGAAVFKGESKLGPKVLKILAPGNVKRSGGKQSVLEGLQYQEGLAECLTGDVAFAGPLRSENGDLGVAIETEVGLKIAIAFNLASGREVEHRISGLQIPINDPKVGRPLFERMGKAAGIMHRYSSEYPIWWSAADADRPDTPFSGRKDRDGGGSAAGWHHWKDYVQSGIADAPELQEHFETVVTALWGGTVNRDEYGYIHADYCFGNMLYDYERLTIIDHNAALGSFLFDFSNAGRSLETPGIPEELRRSYWLSFVSGYCSEYSLKDDWIPRMRAFLDFRRLLFYVMNLQRKKDGGDSFDFDQLDQWRTDMIAGKPWVNIDFSRP